MSGTTKTVRWLLAFAYVDLLISLALQRLDGGFTGNWSFVVLSFAVLNLAFMWEGIVRFAKK